MTKPVLSEDDLELLFANGKKRRKNNFWKYVKYPFLSILLVALVFGALNFSSIKKKILFWYNNDVATEQRDIPSNTTQPENRYADIPNNSIRIDAIDVSAPILWNITNKPKEVADGLSQGVIHINGTSKPGEPGNVFITGHSSNYPWAKGNYNSIFALLDNLVAGDKIQVNNNGSNYIYTVTDKKVVNPDDISVMQQTSDNRLTLMTCVPVGTNLRRLIVTAQQVNWDINSN